jgi:hypothetical protein
MTGAEADAIAVWPFVHFKTDQVEAAARTITVMKK